MEVIPKNPDNDKLLSQLVEGEGAAFEYIVGEYSGDLLQFAYKLTKDTHSASDLVQDVFVDLWERHSRLHNIQSLRNYLFGMVRHRFLRLISRNKLHERTMALMSERMQQMQYSILDVMAEADLQQTLRSVVERLPGNMQRVFLLRNEDYTLREIAEALGLAEQTVKSYNADLNRRIREALMIKHPDISHSLMAVIIIDLTKS